MAEQKSRLVIEIDSRNSQKVAQELNRELKNLESSGDIALKGVRKVGDAAEKQTPKLDQMKTGITKLAQEVKLSFAGMAGTIVGTIGSALTIGAIANLAVQTANTAAELERLSYLSGTTTTEFQEWAVGARAMGIEMDKLSDIFKDTRDRIGDFISTGGGELADFFTEIATKTEGGAKGALELAKAMRELSGPQALQLYVDKLKEAGVSQNEMVYYMESVADEATSLIPLLENGGEGFQLWAEAARNAGAIMDDETLAAAQRLRVETELLQMQINGLKNQFMQALLPALNQIAGAFLATSEQGVQFNGVSESVANTLIWLSKVGMGVAATFDIIGKTIGGAIAAMSDKNITHQMVLDDLGKTVDNWGTKFNKLNDPSSSNKLVDSLTKVQLRANQASKATAASAVNTSKMKETFDKAAGSSKKVADNTERLRREAERAAEEVRRIVYEYSTGEDKKRLDLEKEISHLRKYGMEQYVALAQARHQEEAKLIKMKFEYDLVEHRLTEEQKLRFSSNIKEQEIKADAELTKEQRNLKLDSLNDQFNQELGLIKLAKEQRIFQAQQALYSEMGLIKKRYELERQEIARTVNDPNERAELLNGSFASQSKDEAGVRDQAISDYRGVMGFEESPLVKQFEVLDKMRELDLLNEEAYQNAKLQLQAKSTAGYMEGMLGGFASLVDENSKTYAVLFAAQKAFAVAQAMLNIPAAYSKAYDAVVGTPYVGPYIAPAVGAAAAALQVVQASQIKSTNISGFKSGGYTGNYGKSDVAGVVHGQEYVLNAEATKRVGVNTLNAINNGSTIQAERQAQANAKASGGKPQTIDNNLRVIMVKDENEAKDWLYGPEGEKAFLYHMKRNRSKF